METTIKMQGRGSVRKGKLAALLRFDLVEYTRLVRSDSAGGGPSVWERAFGFFLECENFPWSLPWFDRRCLAVNRQLHRWSRRARRDQRGKRSLIVFQALLWPIAVLLLATGLTLRNATAVGRDFGRGFVALWLECLAFAIQHDIAPSEYYFLRIFARPRGASPGDYLQQREKAAVHRLLQPPAEQMHWVIDKRRFWCVAGELGLPVAPVLATFESGQRTTGEGALPRRDLFHKPLGAFGGEGAECWRYVGEGDCWQRGGRCLSETELLAYCATVDSILQPRILNHDGLRDLMGDALGTLRIVTLRRAGGRIQVLAAALKLPASQVAIDAYWAGGLAAPVDCATGELGAATARDLCRGNFNRHPESGAAIAGRQVPYWPEALRLVERAHSHLDQLTSLGWDVAITGDGPVVIEANTGWNFELMQAASGVPLGTGAFAEWAADWLPGEFRVAVSPPDTGTGEVPRTPERGGRGRG